MIITYSKSGPATALFCVQFQTLSAEDAKTQPVVSGKHGILTVYVAADDGEAAVSGARAYVSGARAYACKYDDECMLQLVSVALLHTIHALVAARELTSTEISGP